MEITYFRMPSELREWFEQNDAASQELWVGYYKKGSTLASITWTESVDEALCFGWIDGIRKSVDDLSYTIRFTPRRPGSTWSAVNIRRAQALIEEGRMTPAGMAAYEARLENKSGIYSYETRRDQLEEPYASMLQENQAAWDFFQTQPPSSRRAVYWWIMSAKKEETRLKRLEQLIKDSADGRLVPPMRRNNTRDNN